MKIQELTLKNFAAYDNVTVSFDPDTTYLIGPNGAGKTTMGLTGIHFMFQGIAEKSTATTKPLIGDRFRFIGSHAKTAIGEMILHDEKANTHITVTRKLTKTGSELSFEAPAGMQLSQQWLNDLFNVFLIAPKRFCELSGKDQAKALGIDTSEYDSKIAKLKADYTLINRDLKNIGELVAPDKIERVDVTTLQAEKNDIRAKLNEKYLENKKANEEALRKWRDACSELNDKHIIACNDERARVNQFNEKVVNDTKEYNTAYDAVKFLVSIGYTGDAEKWVSVKASKLEKEIKYTEPERGDLPPEPVYIPELPDDYELKTIDEKILRASETNAQAYEYDQYEIKLAQQVAKQDELQQNKDNQYAESQRRLTYIQSFVLADGMEVNDDGELVLKGKPLKEPYFSTGELLKIIPALISSQNPELKYVFIQDASLLDEAALAELEADLVGRGFQLVLEIVGQQEVVGKNCIMLKSINHQ